MMSFQGITGLFFNGWRGSWMGCRGQTWSQSISNTLWSLLRSPGQQDTHSRVGYDIYLCRTSQMKLRLALPWPDMVDSLLVSLPRQHPHLHPGRLCHTLSTVFRAITLSLLCGRDLAFTTVSVLLNLQGLSFALAPFRPLEGLANVFTWSYVAKFAKAIHFSWNWLIMLLLLLRFPLQHITLQIGWHWRDFQNPVKGKVG